MPFVVTATLGAAAACGGTVMGTSGEGNGAGDGTGGSFTIARGGGGTAQGGAGGYLIMGGGGGAAEGGTGGYRIMTNPPPPPSTTCPTVPPPSNLGLRQGYIGFFVGCVRWLCSF